MTARSLGYDVEIDVWYKDGTWWLGHDAPTYVTTLALLKMIDSETRLDHHAWLHAKNIQALYQLRLCGWSGHYFYHQNDDVVLTSSGYLWTYPGRELTPASIGVMPEWANLLDQTQKIHVHGWCSDFVHQLRN